MSMRDKEIGLNMVCSLVMPLSEDLEKMMLVYMKSKPLRMTDKLFKEMLVECSSKSREIDSDADDDSDEEGEELHEENESAEIGFNFGDEESSEEVFDIESDLQGGGDKTELL